MPSDQPEEMEKQNIWRYLPYEENQKILWLKKTHCISATLPLPHVPGVTLLQQLGWWRHSVDWSHRASTVGGRNFHQIFWGSYVLGSEIYTRWGLPPGNAISSLKWSLWWSISRKKTMVGPKCALIRQITHLIILSPCHISRPKLHSNDHIKSH